MRVLRIRVLVILCALYLFLVGLLYHFLWRVPGSINTLFDSPGQGNSQLVNSDVVQFNFKRRNGPTFHENNQTLNKVTGKTNATHRVLSAETHSGEDGTSNKITNTSPPIFDVTHLNPPNYCVHTFYYLWYRNENRDGHYSHWNHQYLPHWKNEITAKYPQGRHSPPDDIGASFYPELGCYSSTDPRTMEAHMFQLRKAGVGVVSVSWYPEGMADDEGGSPDELIPELLDVALKYGVRVTLHIEPYRNRTPHSVRTDLEYIHRKYTSHSAFLKLSWPVDGDSDRLLPLVYVYDSYLSSAEEWAAVLKGSGRATIRGTPIDTIMLGLLVEKKHQQSIMDGGFDGFYTYFASDRFSYGSTIGNWKALEKFARDNRLLFVPSVGPGYNDERVRPWNKPHSKSRQNGSYFKKMFGAAISNAYFLKTEHTAKVVSLTSFNEWHEGTQIELAIPKTFNNYSYLNYHPHSPDFYLQLTSEWASTLQCFLDVR